MHSLVPDERRRWIGALLCVAGILCFGAKPAAWAAEPDETSAIRVINGGVPGENSSELQRRFAAELTRWRPNRVVLYTGMNDAANDKKFTSPQQYKANLELMLTEARSRGIQVLLVAIQPVDERRVLKRHPEGVYGSEPPNQRIHRLNQILKGLARERHLTLVRFDTVLQTAGGPTGSLSVDGIHFSAQGYALLARSVDVALLKEVHAGETILCLGDSLTFGIGVRPADADVIGLDGRPYPTYPVQLQQQLSLTQRQQ